MTDSVSKGEPSSSNISVFFVDDHPPIRRAASRAFESKIDLRACGHAPRVDGAVEQIEEAGPEVVVVDISLPDGHGLDLVKTLREKYPEIGIVVFSIYDETIYAERALRAGAFGYVMKSESLSKLIRAIRRAEREEIFLSQSMATKVLSTGGAGASRIRFAIDELTDRERQVLERLGRGDSVDDIQEELGLSRKTIETYRRRAKEKLGVESTTELLQYALQWTYGPNAEVNHLKESTKESTN